MRKNGINYRPAYPLKFSVKEIIKISQQKGGDGTLDIVIDDDYPENQDNKNEYLIVKKNPYIDPRLIIKCNRFIGDWKFYLPNTNKNQIGKGKCIYVEKQPEIKEQLEKLIWIEPSIGPLSLVSEHCVMKSEGKNDFHSLEEILKELLGFLEDIAKKDMSIPYSNPFWKRIYIPIIVTTANLQSCIFDPNTIKKGSIDNCKINKIELIRIRMNLSTNIEDNELKINEDIKSVYQKNQFTVLILQEDHMMQSLGKFSYSLQ